MVRSKTWGFPRWGGYNSETSPRALRRCEREGCAEPGEYPAPKARDSRDKYWFCQAHAAEYNRTWNYFAGMSYEEMRTAAEADARDYSKYATSAAWDHAESGSPWTPEERRALSMLNLTEDATADEIKTRYRELAKRFHPDANRGDQDAAMKFHAVHQAYDLLRRPEADKKRRA